MQRENTRRIIRNVAVIGGIVLAVVVVFLLIRALFFMPAAPKTQMTDPLLDTSVDRGVQMVVRGPIVGEENARSYEIDVTPTGRSVTEYSGYDGTVLNKQVYGNSPAAYTQFVYALDMDNMTANRNVTNDDTRGVCATGRLYSFSLEQDTEVGSTLWTSSCSSAKGTLDAPALPLVELFDAQIPDVTKYTGGLY